ncbi:MAG: transcriptional regulator NrdR [Firmicutes bacterium]|nr:transcriptional regulator NrdR [Bacillota bacterium]
MKCIFCGNLDSKVVDSRTNDATNSTRRRRECTSCSKRFTSYETVEVIPLLVVKKDGRREAFNKHKVKAGMVKSSEKRPISIAQIDEAVEEIEKKLTSTLDQEITSQRIGELILEQLKRLDAIAYVRFSAVYKHFSDITSFLDYIKKLEAELSTTKKKAQQLSI